MAKLTSLAAELLNRSSRTKCGAPHRARLLHVACAFQHSQPLSIPFPPRTYCVSRWLVLSLTGHSPLETQCLLAPKISSWMNPPSSSDKYALVPSTRLSAALTAAAMLAWPQMKTVEFE